MPFPTPLAQALTSLNLPPYPSVTGLPQPITLRSLAAFFGSLVWAWLLLVSFTGWGRWTGKLFRVQRLPASVACSLGIAAMVFLGGWLNLLHAIYPSVLIALTAIGLVFYIALRGQRPEKYKWLSFWNDAPRWSKILIILTLLVLVLRVAATVRLGEFLIDDDGAGYLVFPQKLLAAHHFATDPFSDRRLISSLGGSYFLQSFVIVATSLAHIGMADRSIGLILIFLALLDLGVAFGLSFLQIAVIELIAYIVPQPTFNLTFTILPIALFLTMVWVVFITPDDNHRQLRYAVLLGTIGGAIVSLKSTFLPYVGALTLFPLVLLFWRKRRSRAWLLPVLAGIASLATVVAWMIAMKQASGTYLFPILGHGFDYSSYNLFPSMPRFSSTHAFIKTFLQGSILLVLALVQYYAGIGDKRARLSFGALLAAAFAITAFNYESGGDFIWRYNFPQFFTAILVFFAAQAANYKTPLPSGKNKLAYAFAIFSLISCIFYYDLEGGHLKPFRQMQVEMHLYRGDLRASLSGRHLVSPGIAAEYRAAETSIPAGAAALAVANDAFLFRNSDNRKILLDDWPGASGPPPGWPINTGPEAVKDYLLHNSVRYVIYGYKYAGWSSMRACQFFQSATHFSTIDGALQRLNLIALHQFDQLRATHELLYDDGKIAVIDLNSPSIHNFSSEPDWTLHTSMTQICTAITQRYFAAHSPNSLADSLHQNH